MPRPGTLVLTGLALIAFAANSVLCRLALGSTETDPASFTMIRVVSGAVTLSVIALLRGGRLVGAGNWKSAFALFAYAAGFSFAYVTLDTGTGALLLFGAVQLTMVGWGFWSGERPGPLAIVGILLSTAGVVFLFLPGATAPPLVGAALMILAGAAWGIYSLRGRTSSRPLDETAAHFVYATPFVVVLSLIYRTERGIDEPGLLAAIASGGLASGVGYAIWYAALPALKAATAATVQLSVPVLAAIAGIVFLGETTTLRLVIAAVAILGGIALVIQGPTGISRE